MKKINRKKLNNKGFTLIELLAVVVILAVVMGIATTSVLSAMNKSRAGSLEDSALVIAQAFNQKYTESLVDGVPNRVYSDVLGDLNNDGTIDGYNFQTSRTYRIVNKLADTFNISGTNYRLPNELKYLSSATGNYTNSFVHFNDRTGKFTVCLIANNTGNIYVRSMAIDAGKKAKVLDDGNGLTRTIGSKETAIMFACSNGVNSWTLSDDVISDIAADSEE